MARWIGVVDPPNTVRADLAGDRMPLVEINASSDLLWPTIWGLAWGLTQDSDRYVLPSFDGYWNAELEGVAVQSVEWEYAIDGEKPSWPERDGGFCRARSLPPRSQRPRDELTTAALARVQTPRALHALTTFGDQFNTTTLFAMAGGGDTQARLVSALSGPRMPTWSSVITHERDVAFVGTQDDDGYPGLDSFVIAAGPTIADELPAAFAELDARIDRFGDEASAATTMDELISAAERLAGL